MGLESEIGQEQVWCCRRDCSYRFLEVAWLRNPWEDASLVESRSWRKSLKKEEIAESGFHPAVLVEEVMASSS